jgi:hypothetical protein
MKDQSGNGRGDTDQDCGKKIREEAKGQGADVERYLLKPYRQ